MTPETPPSPGSRSAPPAPDRPSGAQRDAVGHSERDGERDEARRAASRVDRSAGDAAAEETVPVLLRGFSVVHAALALLFTVMALMLLAIAAKEMWVALHADWDDQAAQLVIEAMGVLAAAVVALQIAQTVTEEEVIRTAHISAPTRVRRFLSRFMVVIVVALAIEALVATFRAAHSDSTLLLHAAAMVLAVGALLTGWGLFIRLNRAAEELEPEAMQEAKREDHKLK